jgi:acylphosphatase
MDDRKREATKARLHATVQGRVQGVSFRYYTQKRANELGLTGYVRNLPNGSVEVVAVGPRGDLEELLSFLHVGPRAAYVIQVDVRWSEPDQHFERFGVRY